MKIRARENSRKVGRVECDQCNVTFTSAGNLARHKRLKRCKGVIEVVGNRKNASKKVPKLKTGASSSCSIPREPEVTLKTRNKKVGVVVSKKQVAIKSNCVRCGDTFNSRKLLKKHYITSHKLKMWNCKICRAWYMRLDSLQRHIKEMHDSKLCESIPCKDCGLNFSHAIFLRNHKIIRHSKKAFECNVCKYTYSNLQSLAKHCQAKSHELLESLQLQMKKVSPSAKIALIPVRQPKTRKSSRIRKSPKIFSPYSKPSPSTTEARSPSNQNNLKVQKPKQVNQKLTLASRKKPNSQKNCNDDQSNGSQLVSSYPAVKLEFLPRPPSSTYLTSVFIQAQQLQQALVNHQEKQRQRWDPSFFLHMNRYVPES